MGVYRKMGTMTTTLNTIMESNITLNTIESLLADKFNISLVTSNEIYIKPERKENKDNLINRIKDIISETTGLNINPEVYVRVYKTTGEIVVRVKRIKRNSR